MSGNEWVSEEMKTIDGKHYVQIRLNWTDVKGYRIEYEYTEVLCIAWIYIMDDEDYIIEMYQIDYPLHYLM
jgi:hypothetical protein